MKNPFYIYLLIALVLSSCYQIEKPKQPDTFLSEQEMIDLLTEISILSAAKGINKKRLEENGITPKDYIYKKHKIDSAIFAQNNIYYSHDLEVYNRIYDKLKDTLTLLKTNAEKKNKNLISKEKMKNDLMLGQKQTSKRDSITKTTLLENRKSLKNRTLK